MGEEGVSRAIHLLWWQRHRGNTDADADIDTESAAGAQACFGALPYVLVSCATAVPGMGVAWFRWRWRVFCRYNTAKYYCMLFPVLRGD